MWFTIILCSLLWLFCGLLVARWLGQARKAEARALEVAFVEAMLRREQAAALGDAEILIDLEHETPADVWAKLDAQEASWPLRTP